MPKAVILVLDSLGIGSTPDADRFGDQGANTLGSIAKWCQAGHLSQSRESGSLRIPNLMAMGLGAACKAASNEAIATAVWSNEIIADYAACQEVSTGKDTPSGHWEMAGVPVRFDWGYFPDQADCFPPELITELISKTGVPGILGNCHGSGTDIIERFGESHLSSGMPICYTSADSVFQVAAHEESFGLERLLEFCKVARSLLNQYNIGRVIARPFVGQPGNFVRTGNRKDYTTPPHELTLLDYLVEAGREVHSIGKIADIFAHRGITHSTKATGHDALFDATIAAIKTAADGGLIFTNFVEFDQSFGHRRNVAGYASALEHFDNRLPEIIESLNPDDLLVLTADHGCDPTWPGNDHTREYIPFLMYRKNLTQGTNFGIRKSFADIGQTIAHILGIPKLKEGISTYS